MTRKHFVAIAKAFNEARPPYEPQVNESTIASYNQWCILMRAIADVCESTSPRFNRSTFITACEGGTK